MHQESPILQSTNIPGIIYLFSISSKVMVGGGGADGKYVYTAVYKFNKKKNVRKFTK